MIKDVKFKFKRSKNSDVMHESSFHSCCPCCPCLPRNNKFLEWLGNKYWSYFGWYKHYFGEDTQYWFVLLIFREMFEIIFQYLALLNYNGINLLNPNELVLAFKDWQVLTFSILLGLNAIIFGLLWIVYILDVSRLIGSCQCRGRLFKTIIFGVDTLFDTFYALFPIVLVTIDTGFNPQIAVGVLQSPNLYVVIVCLYISSLKKSNLFLWCYFLTVVLYI